MPASNTVTPPSSSIRYTFMVFTGKPPRTSHTPSATWLTSGLKNGRSRRVRVLNADAMRRSVVLSCAGSRPTARANWPLS